MSTNATGSPKSTRYAAIAQGFRSRLLGVGSGQLSHPVPSCPEWTVRELITHVLGTHQGVLGTIEISFTPEAGDATTFAAQFDRARHEVIRALDDPQLAARIIHSPVIGERTFGELANSLLCGDTLFHTWDLAHATGQDEDLGEDSCRAVLTALTPFDDAIRFPRFFGQKLPAPPGADVQQRLLSFGGRRG